MCTTTPPATANGTHHVDTPTTTTTTYANPNDNTKFVNESRPSPGISGSSATCARPASTATARTAAGAHIPAMAKMPMAARGAITMSWVPARCPRAARPIAAPARRVGGPQIRAAEEPCVSRSGASAAPAHTATHAAAPPGPWTGAIGRVMSPARTPVAACVDPIIGVALLTLVG